jgi:hypothetical protein
LTDAAAAASDSVVRLADGLELGSLCAQSLPRLLELDRLTFHRGEPGNLSSTVERVVEGAAGVISSSEEEEDEDDVSCWW